MLEILLKQIDGSSSATRCLLRYDIAAKGGETRFESLCGCYSNERKVLMGYHEDISELTKTQLMTFGRSRVRFYHTYITKQLKQPKKKTTMVGSVCHAVLLEDKPLNDVFKVYPASCLKSDGAINSKPAEAFRADNPDCENFGKLKDELQILSVLAAVRESQLAPLIEAAHEREETHYGEYNGRAIKCKPDFYSPGIIYDLKFTATADDPDIARNFRNFKYWLQDAHYSACVGGDPVFRFWVVETSFPYRIKSRCYNVPGRENAREKWVKMMDEFIIAENSNNWEDETHVEYDVSPWDVDANEDGELVDIGEAT